MKRRGSRFPEALAGRRILGIAAILGTGLAAWSLLDVYAVNDPYAQFLGPARSFLQGAVARDSAGLARAGAAPPVIRWALDTARDNPALLRDLARGLRVGGGMRNGDRAVVFFSAPSFKRCPDWPLRIVFSGPPATARIEEVKGGCSDDPA